MFFIKMVMVYVLTFVLRPFRNNSKIKFRHDELLEMSRILVPLGMPVEKASC